MYARVTMFPGLAPERIKATLAEFNEKHLPLFEQQPGYRGVWAGVDYIGGRAIAVTYWDSLESMQASDTLANEIRAAAVTRAGVDRNRPPITDKYEIVVQKEPAKTSLRNRTGAAEDASVPLERSRDTPEATVVLVPLTVQMPADHNRCDGSRAGRFQRGRGTLRICARRPGVVDQQY